MSSLPLAEDFLLHRKGDAAATAALEALLHGLLASGQQAWPGVVVPAADFMRYLAERVPKGPAEDLPGALENTRCADLYLTCGCAAGVPEALRAFDSALLGQVPAFLARLSPTPVLIDEVRQQLREKLLVAGPASPPRIADYAGRGALFGWVRIAAVRTALNLRAQKQPADPGPADDLLDALPAVADPELDHIKAQYRQEFLQSLREAVQSLSSRQRNVLRLSFVRGLTGEQIGAVLGVRQATVSRWLTAAREAIQLEVQRGLRERLRLSESELSSLLVLVRSRLDLSLASLFQESGDNEDA